MKIAILTLSLKTNYGGILQAYALQTILERLGHEVYVITSDYIYKIEGKRRILVYLKRLLLYILGKRRYINQEKHDRKIFPYVSSLIRPFIKNNIHCFHTLKFQNFKSDLFDAVVVGSDQVWRKGCFVSVFGISISHAYLKFASSYNIRRVSYAASFGTKEWEYSLKETLECKKLLEKFDYVSVREYDAKILCKEKYNIDAEVVLDPTLLLNIEDYRSLFLGKVQSDKKGLLVYVLDENDLIKTMIKFISTTLDIDPFDVSYVESDLKLPFQERKKNSIEYWLQCFNDADFVITDSFHACVFSILFHKQFYVCGNVNRGLSRFTSLLNQFDLQDRLIHTVSDINFKKINYDIVEAKLQTLRRESLEFLDKSLK